MRMSLAQIKDRLNDNALEALQWLMKAGKRYGREFCCGDIYGKPAKPGKRGSFAYNIDRMTGTDFATSDRGFFGVYDVFVHHCRGDQRKALELARSFLHLPVEQRPEIQIGHEQGSRKKKGDPDLKLLKVYDRCPDFPPTFPSRHQHCLVRSWKFSRLDGSIAGYSYRIEFENSEGKTKLVLPLTWCQVEDIKTQKVVDRWFNAGLPRPQPLMHVSEVAAAQKVLLIEGEKTCDASNALRKDTTHPFSRFDVGSSWHGGTNRLEYVDWSVLNGKDVTYWPDADDPNSEGYRPGFRAGEKLPFILQKQGVKPRSFRLTTPHTDVGQGWDPGDPLPEGLDLSWIERKLIEAEVYMSP